jgi:hypothetical protein
MNRLIVCRWGLALSFPKRLNVPPYRIAYLLTTRKLPEPKRVGNRRVFTTTDARQVEKALGITREAITASAPTFRPFRVFRFGSGLGTLTGRQPFSTECAIHEQTPR